MFADTTRAVGAKYAIPFASNHCHLHPETIKYNKYIQTPFSVAEYFKKENISNPQLKVMLSGDYFCSESGFHINDCKWFSEHEKEIEKYKKEIEYKLVLQEKKENNAKVNIEQVKKYFSNLSRSIPFIARFFFRKIPITFILSSGENKVILTVNISNGSVSQLECFNDKDNPLQIHTSLFIFRQCIGLGLFSHLSISKRVRYRCLEKNTKYIKLFNLLLNMYEYDIIPLRKLLSIRSIGNWVRRWRELVLYGQLVMEKVLSGRMRFQKYLNIPPKEA